MNPEEELKAAIDWQVKIQINTLQQQAEFHKGNMNAQGVGPGHQSALQTISLKVEALQRFQADHSLLTHKMKAEALHAFRDYITRLKEKEAEQKASAEKARLEREAAVEKMMTELSKQGFGQQPPGIPQRRYIRDVNC
jgi:hypothetical protein